jgi:hypothetical protein
MKLQSAEFCFGAHKVVFVGPKICVYADAGGPWELVAQEQNKWHSRVRREDNGVMGRRFKPRVTDAHAVLDAFLKHGKKVKPDRA